MLNGCEKILNSKYVGKLKEFNVVDLMTQLFGNKNYREQRDFAVREFAVEYGLTYRMHDYMRVADLDASRSEYENRKILYSYVSEKSKTLLSKAADNNGINFGEYYEANIDNLIQMLDQTGDVDEGDKEHLRAQLRQLPASVIAHLQAAVANNAKILKVGNSDAGSRNLIEKRDDYGFDIEIKGINGGQIEIVIKRNGKVLEGQEFYTQDDYDKKCSYEEVYQYELGVSFDPEAIELYRNKKAELDKLTELQSNIRKACYEHAIAERNYKEYMSEQTKNWQEVRIDRNKQNQLYSEVNMSRIRYDKALEAFNNAGGHTRYETLLREHGDAYHKAFGTFYQPVNAQLLSDYTVGESVSKYNVSLYTEILGGYVYPASKTGTLASEKFNYFGGMAFTVYHKPASIDVLPAPRSSEKSPEHISTLMLLANMYTPAAMELNEYVKNAGFSDVAVDAISALWGSKNRFEIVDAELNEFKSYIYALSEAANQGEEAFAEMFKSIFGVEYSYENVLKYQKDAKLKQALLAEEAVNDALKPISDDIDELMALIAGFKVKLGGYDEEGRLNEIIDKIAKFISPGNSEAWVKSFKEIYGKLPTNEQLATIRNIISEYKDTMSQQTLEAAKNSSMSESQIEDLGPYYSDYAKKIKDHCQVSYERAFGTDNDVMKRVTEYIDSQESGACWFKTITKIAATIALIAAAAVSGGSSLAAIPALLMEAGIAAGVSLSVDILDELSKANPNFGREHFLEMFKEAGMAALSTFVLGGVARIPIVKSMGFVAQSCTMVSAGEAFEFATTGELTLDGFVFNVAMTFGIGGTMKLVEIKGKTPEAEAFLRGAREKLGIEGELSAESIESAWQRLSNSGEALTEDIVDTMIKLHVLTGKELPIELVKAKIKFFDEPQLTEILNDNTASTQERALVAEELESRICHVRGDNGNVENVHASNESPNTHSTTQIQENDQINHILQIDEGIPIVRPQQSIQPSETNITNLHSKISQMKNFKSIQISGDSLTMTVVEDGGKTIKTDITDISVHSDGSYSAKRTRTSSYTKNGKSVVKTLSDDIIIKFDKKGTPYILVKSNGTNLTAAKKHVFKGDGTNINRPLNDTDKQAIINKIIDHLKNNNLENAYSCLADLGLSPGMLDKFLAVHPIIHDNGLGLSRDLMANTRLKAGCLNGLHTEEGFVNISTITNNHQQKVTNSLEKIKNELEDAHKHNPDPRNSKIVKTLKNDYGLSDSQAKKLWKQYCENGGNFNLLDEITINAIKDKLKENVIKELQDYLGITYKIDFVCRTGKDIEIINIETGEHYIFEYVKNSDPTQPNYYRQFLEVNNTRHEFANPKTVVNESELNIVFNKLNNNTTAEFYYITDRAALFEHNEIYYMRIMDESGNAVSIYPYTKNALQMDYPNLDLSLVPKLN